MLSFFNTWSRKKELFRPLKAKVATFYSCGPTVYHYPHIGNLRPYFFGDVLKRVLNYDGLRVKHVMNLTDVGHLVSDGDEGEDKIEISARQRGQTAWEVAEFFTDVFRRDLEMMNILNPDIFCKATDHIAEQIKLIKRLEKKSFVYRIEDGLYFDSGKFKNYGQLARLKIKGLKAGARVKMRTGKKRSTDFALWKFSYPNGRDFNSEIDDASRRRQMEWKSPWGLGFPGWHLECSAMAMKYLGETIDIHTGGIDHIPVHHTNEIAQSEVATGKKFVRYWGHNNFLLVDGRKMSKSLGNIVTLDEIVDRGFESLTLRYLFLTVHYRSKMNFTWQALTAAQQALRTLRLALSEWPVGELPTPPAGGSPFLKKFQQAIDNDLNTPKALAVLWEVFKSDLPAPEKKSLILEFDKVLGLKLAESQTEKIELVEAPSIVQAMVEKREALRHSKKWPAADQLREKINAAGYLIEDTPEGPQLKKLRK